MVVDDCCVSVACCANAGAADKPAATIQSAVALLSCASELARPAVAWLIVITPILPSPRSFRSNSYDTGVSTQQLGDVERQAMTIIRLTAAPLPSRSY